MFTALGFVGIFLPVLPTVPFLIVAVACFARSSPRMERWLLDHQAFGPMLRDWREKGAIPLFGKLMALAGCAGGFAVFIYLSHPAWWLIALVAALMISALSYVFTRPSSGR